MKPTKELYDLLRKIHDHFNKALFHNELKPVMFIITRRKKIMGCYIEQKWTKDNNISDEIAINPMYFDKFPILEIMQTLVHEMCHQWQYNHGSPGRKGYHNKEFATKMQAIGLMPSSTGEPGGKTTGQHMNDYAIENGKFMIAAKKLLDQKAFKSLWYDRNSLNLSSSDADGDSDSDGEDASDKKKKIKYTDSVCELNIWGKPGLNILCADCGDPYEPNI